MDSEFKPGYLKLPSDGVLAEKVREAYRRLESCDLCPRKCGTNRLQGKQGFCRAGLEPLVASHNIHRGEEPPISGVNGSGTIFFSRCVARCMFCQNYPISQMEVGEAVSVEELAGMMLSLQQRRAHNINFVTPTHFVPQILAALEKAIPRGFRLPLVYNTSGWETLETLTLLDGVVDIYLPDAKYADDAVAKELSKMSGYVEINRAALKEMYRQVGDLMLDNEGVATRGLIIRHLVLPNGLSQTGEVLRFVAEELSPEVHVSLMDQYFPAHRALSYPPLSRPLRWEEYEEAVDQLDRAGLSNGWVQEHDELLAQGETA
ncbi:MAG: radical SAM protein [Chloroflexi bacterium]|nr:radical SAM protein [Chloroflexota bacterium]